MKRIAVAFIFFCMSFLIFADASSQMLEAWNTLSEEEKWFCLLSEPLMEQNKLSITTVNPEKYVPSGTKSFSQSILEESWELFSKEDVLIKVEEYKLNNRDDGGSGQNLKYSILKNQLNQILSESTKNPAILLDQLIIKECMDFRTIVRLFFVAEMRNVLGEYGLLAWDYGRILSVLRWSIAANWLSENEALNLAKPFIDELLNAYDSWEDYASHYALGRAYFASSDGKDYNAYLNTVMNCIKKYDIEVSEDEKDKVFTYHNTKFPAKNQHNNRILTYKDAVYKPSKDAASWIMVVKAERNFNELKTSEINALNTFLKKKLNVPAAAYFRTLIQAENESKRLTKSLDAYKDKYLSKDDEKKIANIYTTAFKNVLRYFDEGNPAFEKVENKNDLFFMFYIRYAFTAHQAGDFQKMGIAVANFDDDKCNAADCQNISCVYYTQKAKESYEKEKYEDAVEYAELALYCLQKGKSLPSWEVFGDNFVKGYEKTLNDIISESKYHLRQFDNSNLSA